MARNRASARLQADWNAWVAGNSRTTEIERLERELEESRARERHARHETAETRERFEGLLDASRRFTHTLSERRRHQHTSRRYLSVQHTIDSVLLEADGLEDAAAGVLKALGENLGWQVTVLWVAGEETLRYLEIWHRPNAAPDGFEAACLRTRCVRGEGLPGIAWAENRPVWAGELPQEGGFGSEADSPEGRLRSVLAFPISGAGDPCGIIELFGSEVLHRDEELHYTVWLVGRRIGQFVDRRQAEKELHEAEERLRLATEAGRVGLLDLEPARIGHGLRGGRPSQRYRLHACRISLLTMMPTSEKATQKSITLPTRSVHHTSFLWALCHELVLSTTHRSLAQNGADLPFLEISASSPRSLRRSRVAFESYPRSRWTFIPSGSPPKVSATVSRVSGSSGESWWLAGAAKVPRGMPSASTIVERLRPCLPRSTGLLPAFCPPHGALVMQQSTATSESSRPMYRS